MYIRSEDFYRAEKTLKEVVPPPVCGWQRYVLLKILNFPPCCFCEVLTYCVKWGWNSWWVWIDDVIADCFFFYLYLISTSLEATIFVASWNHFCIYYIVLSYFVLYTAAEITSGQSLLAMGALQFVETCVSSVKRVSRALQSVDLCLIL